MSDTSPGPQVQQGLAMLGHALIGLWMPIVIIVGLLLGLSWGIWHLAEGMYLTRLADLQSQGGDMLDPLPDMPEEVGLTMAHLHALTSVIWAPVAWSLLWIPYSIALVVLQMQCLLRFSFGQRGSFAEALPYVTRRIWAVMGVGLIALLGISMWSQLSGSLAGLASNIVPGMAGAVLAGLLATVITAPAYAVLGTSQATLLMEAKPVPDALQAAWARGAENLLHGSALFAIVLVLATLVPNIAIFGWMAEITRDTVDMAEEEVLVYFLSENRFEGMFLPFALMYISTPIIMLTGAVFWHQTRPAAPTTH